MKNQTIEEIIEYMTQAESVNDWNKRRDILKDSFEVIPDWFFEVVDRRGLIKGCSFAK